MKRSHDGTADHARPRRGGLRQRIAVQNRGEQPQVEESALCTLLLGFFAWGQIDAQLCQSIAAAAYKDACDMKEQRTTLGHLERMSTIGCGGRYPNKCYGELMERLPYQIKVPLPFVEKLPFKSPLNSLSQAFLLPHELFASIWEWYPNTWNKYILPSKQKLQQFWDRNMEHPSMASHSVKDREGFSTRAIPFSLHGDDVPITGIGKCWCSMMTTFSICSMVALGETRDMSFFIYGSFERIRAKDPDQNKDTLAQFFRLLGWSLHWLFRGQWPDEDWKGQKHLAGASVSLCFFISCIFWTPNKISSLVRDSMS